MKDLTSTTTTEIEQSEHVVKVFGQPESATNGMEQTLSLPKSSNQDMVNQISELDDIPDEMNELVQV